MFIKTIYKVCKGKLRSTKNLSCPTNLSLSLVYLKYEKLLISTSLWTHLLLPTLICIWVDLFVFIYSWSLNFALLSSWRLHLKIVIVGQIFLRNSLYCWDLFSWSRTVYQSNCKSGPWETVRHASTIMEIYSHLKAIKWYPKSNFWNKKGNLKVICLKSYMIC